MQSRKQHQRRSYTPRHDGKREPTDARVSRIAASPPSGDVETPSHVFFTKYTSKKNLQAKSPLRFTNKYRKTPNKTVDVSEKRVRAPFPTSVVLLRMHSRAHSLRRSGTLQALRRVICRDLTLQERLQEVLAQIDRTQALPKTSKYARHKLEILGKAKTLLEQKIGSQAPGNADDELETLLRELRIN
jgi:hypothetical protein